MIDFLRRKLVESHLDSELHNHLTWMMDETAKSMHPDKKGRWLGYVASYLMTSVTYDVLLLLETQTPFYQVFQNIHKSLYERYRCPDFEQKKSKTLEQASFYLGFLQGKLVQAGKISVDEERSVTRPLFHGAYIAMGWDIPPSLGR